MRPRRWIGAGAVIALALTLITIHSLDAPLFLYPSSASLPAGLYMRSVERVQRGAVVAFSIPEIARRYRERHGARPPTNYLFLKPIIAGAGDHICNDTEKGLRVNGNWIAPLLKTSEEGASLPIWRSCRILNSGEFFTFSRTVTNSFDSRYYGTIHSDEILGAYRRVF